MSAYENQYINKIRDNRNFTFKGFKSDNVTITNPIDGDMFIVKSGINAFLGKDNKIATYTSEGYVFTDPKNGWDGFDSTNGDKYVFYNGIWHENSLGDWDGVINTDMIPNTPSTYNLGTAENPLKEIHADEMFVSSNSLYVDGAKVLSSVGNTVEVTTDIDQHLTVTTSGLGTTRIASGKEVMLYSGNVINLQSLGDITTLSQGRIAFKTNADGDNIVFETQGNLSNINFKSKHQTNIDCPDINFTSTPKVNGVAIAVGAPDLSNYDTKTEVDTKISESITTEITTHNESVDSHTDIRNSIPTDVSQLVNDSNFINLDNIIQGTNIVITKDIENNTITISSTGEGGSGLIVHPAIISPTISDDISLGYDNYTFWINTDNNNVFILQDNTIGNANWINLTTGASTVSWDEVSDKPTFSMVATSGSYNDLSDVPTIPTVPTLTSQLTNDSDFVVDASYVHTDNNYTAIEKEKLERISDNATKTEASSKNGNILINGVETKVYELPTLNGTDIALAVDSFNKNLDNTITDVQKLADKVDELVLGGATGGSLPSGGTVGQILIKQDSTDGNALWEDNTALKTKFNNVNFTANNVDSALVELFQYANNIKTRVAEVIGSPILATQDSLVMKNQIQILKNDLATYLGNKLLSADGNTETLKQLIDKVDTINQSVTSQIQSTKLNIVAPYTKTFQLSSPVELKNLCTSLIEYVFGDVGFAKYNIDFDNGDASSFQTNTNLIFDGKMKLDNSFDYTMNDLGVLGTGNQYESDLIVIDDFNSIDELSADLSGLTLNLLATKQAQIAIPLNFSDISGIEKVESIEWITNTSGNGVSLLAISFDAGVTFGGYNTTTSTWDIVDINNATDFLSKGMTKATADSLTNFEIESFRNENTNFMGSYLLKQTDSYDIAENDKLVVRVELKGQDVIASNSKYNLSYNSNTGVITYDILVSGTYTFNYVNVV